MAKALIVVDMQNDFLTGSLANPDAVAIIPKIKELIDSEEYSNVIFTQDTHNDNYLNTPEGKALPVVHCIDGSWGWEIASEFNYLFDEGNPIYNKVDCWFLNKPTFGTTNLAGRLKGVGEFNEVTFCGTCTDICVVSNALILKAICPELKINVKADCCAGVTPEKHKAALEVMSSCQINII